MASFSRTQGCAIFALTVTVWGVACGHSALDLIPEDSDGGGIAAGDGGSDADLADASVDAGCVGPSCPGTYVSVTVGDDANPGTGVAPVKTIAKGMEIAAKLGGAQNVFVAAGQYTEKVILAEGVNLLGGYECSAQPCTWVRDPETKDTAILDTDFEGVLAGNTITRKTRFEGFRVEGMPGTPIALTGAAAMTLDGGSPILSRCQIHGADTTGGLVNGRRSVGVLLLAPSNDSKGPLIVDNAIKGGAASDGAFGVLFSRRSTVAGGTSTATIKKNRIQGGTAPSAIGIAAWNSDAATVLEDNDISAGTSTAAAGVGPGAWGIAVETAMTIDRNRINTDPSAPASCGPTVAPDFCGGIISFSSSALITNNVIRGVRGPRTCAVALIEAEKAAGKVVLNGNTLDGAGLTPLTGVLSTAIAIRTGVGSTGVFGNVRNNILLSGSNKYRYGVYEDNSAGKVARLAVLERNDFWHPPNAAVTVDNAYRTWNGTIATDVPFAVLGSKLSVLVPALTPQDNIEQDPLLDATWHVQKGSPVIDTGTSNEAPGRDMDGESRPKGVGFDMGADEY